MRSHDTSNDLLYDAMPPASFDDGVGLYEEKRQYLMENCKFVNPYLFYRDLFPEGSCERKGAYEDNKPNAICVTVYKKPMLDGDGKPLLDKYGNPKLKAYGRRTTITDEQTEICEIDDTTLTLMAPITYYGNRRISSRAAEIFALVFDLDGIGIVQLRDLMLQMSNSVIPKATYLVLSGTGIHVYYFFDKPIALTNKMDVFLSELKTALTPYIWNKYTSVIKTPQPQGLYQGYRMIGTVTKVGYDFPVEAYKYGGRVTVDYLYSFLSNQKKKEIYRQPPTMSLRRARELYPEWYQRRIVEGQPVGHWVCKRALYDWWLNRISNEATVGHRYFCVMCLAIYAQKCGVSEDDLRTDAYNLLPRFRSLTNDYLNVFSEDDVEAALQAYNEKASTYPINSIAHCSGLEIKKNKRNPKIDADGFIIRKSYTQAEHCEDMRQAKKMRQERGLGSKNKGGRPSAEPKVAQYLKEHPNASKGDIRRDTGLAYSAIRKYYDKYKQ